MNIELLSALALFAFVSSISPGPNNLILLSSGISFGTRRCLSLLFGINLGFMVMILAIGLGIGEVFKHVPVLYDWLKWISTIYLLFLAYKIACSSAINTDQSQAKPMTFLQAALFQWVNPKAWSMALSAIAVYAPSFKLESTLLVAIIFTLINLPCILSWLLAGDKLSETLKNKRKVQFLNYFLALLLVMSVLPTIL
ncbi:LysE family translocator [Pseudoalteromonas luteoviolacea]|uniref:LysE family translocator n=1 Tax=Pseudoalteromonas luteoviolacea TaxID=43657 RepID=UPI001B383259|nr:LysE family translocator [Pseudoalteromonas luteoviolacea]MBQ4809726.1 LysE family translocator [Pseudoalteromonas luteoviolacea]